MIETEAGVEILPPIELPDEVVSRIERQYGLLGEEAIHEALERAKATRRRIAEDPRFRFLMKQQED